MELRYTTVGRDNAYLGPWIRSDGVSRRPLTAEAYVRTQRRPYGFVVGKIAIRQVHYTAHRLCSVTASPMLHIHSFIHSGIVCWLYTGPIRRCQFTETFSVHHKRISRKCIRLKTRLDPKTEHLTKACVYAWSAVNSQIPDTFTY